MTPLQFSLFFVAILVAYGLVHLRLVRFERYLRELAGIRRANDQLQKLGESLAGLRMEGDGESADALQRELHRLAGGLHQLLASSERIEALLARDGEPQVVLPPAPERAAAADRVRALIETRLLALGYSNLRLLGDLSEASPDGEVSVTVECEKAQIAHKGRVVVRNGGVSTIELKSVVQSFP